MTGVAGPAAYWHDYGFDLVGNRTVLTEHAVGGFAGDVTTTYSYPAAGSSQPHTLLDRASTSGGTQGDHTAYAYDEAGNTVSVDRDGAVDTLQWDAQGHLESITQGGDTTGFVYDADGDRVPRDGPDGMTLFLPGMEVHQAAGSSTVTATRYIDLPGGVTYVESDTQAPEYQIADHHGTGILSLDPATGGDTHRRMDPYGQPRGAAPQQWAGNRGFVGGTADPTGYTHLGAREYDPVTGRFISLDPLMDLTDPQQMHGYAYANNSPVTLSDATGLIRMSQCIDGDCSYHNPDGSLKTKEECEATGGCGRGYGSSHNAGPRVSDQTNGGNGGNGGESPTPGYEDPEVTRAKEIKEQTLLDVVLAAGGQILMELSGSTTSSTVSRMATSAPVRWRSRAPCRGASC